MHQSCSGSTAEGFPRAGNFEMIARSRSFTLARTKHSSSRPSAGDVAWVLAVALVLALLAPASSSGAPGDTCPPGTALTPAYDFVELGQKTPLVATHELTIVASFPDRVRGVTLSVPDGVRMISRSGPRMKLIVPLGASLAVTANWIQGNPLIPGNDPDDPETNCSASATTALPVTATRPSRAYYLRKAPGTDSYVAFAVVRDPQRGDASPLTISLRVAASARFPSARARQRKMPVAMRPSERRRYAKRIPKEEFATTALRCRYYDLICNRRLKLSSWASALQYPGRTIRARNLNGGALLSYVQPFRIVAPYGVMVNVIVGDPFRSAPAAAFDIQVRQSGEVVGRARAAFRCRRERTQFGEYFHRCRAVRRQFG